MNEELKKVDIEAFQADTGVDDRETLKELYSVFLEEMSQEREKLLAMLSIGNFADLAKVIHNIKGVSGSYKANGIFDVSAEFNMRLKTNNLENADTWTREVVNAISSAIDEINEYFGLKEKGI